MTTDIRCPNCGGHFSSTESYQAHLPCRSTTVGGEEDVGTARFAQESEGTSER